MDQKVYTFPFVYKNESKIDIRQYIQKCSECFGVEWISKLKNIILNFYHLSEHESTIRQSTVYSRRNVPGPVPPPPQNRPIIVYTHRTARTRDDDKCSGGQGFEAGLHCLCMSGWCRRKQ